MSGGFKVYFEGGGIGYEAPASTELDHIGKDHGAGSDPEPAPESLVTPWEAQKYDDESNPMMQKYKQRLMEFQKNSLPEKKDPGTGSDPDGETNFKMLIENMRGEKGVNHLYRDPSNPDDLTEEEKKRK